MRADIREIAMCGLWMRASTGFAGISTGRGMIFYPKKRGAASCVTLCTAYQYRCEMMNRLTAVVVAVVALPICAVAQDSRDYFLDRGTTLPRVISSDPMMRPDGDKLHRGAFEGSTVNMSREARRSFDGRAQSELEAYRNRGNTGGNGEFRFNIPPRDMPAPVTN